VNENRDDIEIDDPNFWTKWAKKADIDMEKPKVCTNIQIYYMARNSL
jgi:hypothetical protein